MARPPCFAPCAVVATHCAPKPPEGLHLRVRNSPLGGFNLGCRSVQPAESHSNSSPSMTNYQNIMPALSCNIQLVGRFFFCFHIRRFAYVISQVRARVSGCLLAGLLALAAPAHLGPLNSHSGGGSLGPLTGPSLGVVNIAEEC